MTLRAIAAVAAVLLAPSALAEPKAQEDLEKGLKGSGKYGVAGCGLGSMAFGNQQGAIQILAATTNGILGNQTFGISSGTLNCGPSAFAQGTRNFVEANREVLAKDVARGQGEAIGALTIINQCADSHAVGTALQARFGAIFPSEQATDEHVTSAILETLRADPALGCGKG